MPMTRMTRDRLKVGYVVKRFPRFSETFILNELLTLEAQGVDVEVFSLEHPPEEARHAFATDLRAPVTYLPDHTQLGGLSVSVPGQSSPSASPLRHQLAGSTPLRSLFPGVSPSKAARLTLKGAVLGILASARGITHLHAHFASNATTVALLASRLSAIPFSFTAHARDIYHTYVDPETDDQLRRRKIREAAFVVTVSDFNLDHLRTLAPDAHSRKIRRLYNGTDLARFTPHADAGRPNDRFLAVGRLVEKKGFTHLVDACRLLEARGIDHHCTIVGEGPLRAELEEQIRACAIAHRIELVGACSQERIRTLMQASSAIVLPCVVGKSGDRDGLPTVLLEGMAMRLPVISTQVAGVPEIVDPNRTGLLVPPENATALADALERIHANPEWARHLGARGRKRAEERFDLETNVAQLASWFTRMPASVDDLMDRRARTA